MKVDLSDSNTWPPWPWLPLRLRFPQDGIPELGILHADCGAVVFLINLCDIGSRVRTKQDLLSQPQRRFATLEHLHECWEID